MFVVSEVEAAAIRTAFERSGELAAAVELRRLFPGVTDTMQARECPRTIAGWKPLPPHPPGRRRAAVGEPEQGRERSPRCRAGTPGALT
jgi:hypothetical protein